MHYNPRYRQAREEHGWSRAEFADRMGVEVSTIGNWETGKRQMTLDKLLLMSEVTSFTVHYLLGIDEPSRNWVRPISKTTLSVLHHSPVWTPSHGWGLVNTINNTLIFADSSAIELSNFQEQIYAFPPVLAYSLRGTGTPLRRDDVETRDRVWVEIIITDIELSVEMRGWYHLFKNKFVENEIGQRFYLDLYGSKWLAFEDCLE